MNLEVGMFVKTKGARDGKGLRRVAAVKIDPKWGSTAIMQHYHMPYRGPNIPRRMELSPYSSQVMLDKITHLLTVAPGGYLAAMRKCKVDPLTGTITLI